uniref:AlNc14C94G5809 protein n=1 Tax=Albugo laibachii Nc14 TaxID=890382 RepID=F0WGT2_9STRA|nr:AlNc14C94G5809 [Albugo laibachii Nc14]|eukprot:CCA20446.1 AlNc14C94G5809 [Albugo laibachii Nc14]
MINSLSSASHVLAKSVCAVESGKVDEHIKTFFTKCTCSQAPCEIQQSCTADAAVVVSILIDIYLKPLKLEACISLDVAIGAVVALLNAHFTIPIDVNVSINNVGDLKVFGENVSKTLGLSTLVGPIIDIEAFLGVFLQIDAAALIQTGITESTAHIVVAIMPIMVSLLLCLSVKVHIG